ncbi:MAG: SDR family oxidoreductase [Planctomycetota bacterium]
MAPSPAYLVIGATGGIGRDLTRRLVASGGQVMLIARQEAPLQSFAAEVGQPFMAIDASDWDSVAQAVQQAAERFGGLTGAVNLAGSVLLKPAHLTKFEDYESAVSQNLTTAFALVRAAAPAMRKSGGGSIVLLSSAAADIGLTNHEVIAAVKAAVAGLARSASATYASAGVRVNSVAPGLVETGLTEAIWSNDRSKQASLAMHPSGRLGQPSDIASLIAWLLAPENSWITGQQIAVDGGLGSLKAPAR